MMVREVALTVGLGLIAGLALAFPLTGLLQGTLYGVQTRDPVTLGGAVVFILVMSLAAAWIPARRAALTDPVRSLRAS
jgi:ABC-type lipoprotein release transport system permease subunit